MDGFILLQPEECDQYWIKLPVDFVAEAAWYIRSQSRNPYGPWLVLAFLRHINQPEVMTFRICYYDEDTFYMGEAPMDAFYDSLSGWSFTPAMLEQLIKLLEAQAEKLLDVPKRQPTMFREIPETEWPEWHLERLHEEEKIKFFYQTYDPLEITDTASSFDTIVSISKTENTRLKKNPTLFLDVSRFLKEKLQDPDFSADINWGYINLDRSGVYEFIQLIKENFW